MYNKRPRQFIDLKVGMWLSVVMAGSWSERDVIWLKPSHHLSLHRFSVLINIIIWCMVPTISFPDKLLSKWACPIYSIFCRVNRPAQILISHRADGPHSRLLDFLSSRWARPIYSIFCRVNGPGPSSRWAVRVNGSEQWYFHWLHKLFCVIG